MNAIQIRTNFYELNREPVDSIGASRQMVVPMKNQQQMEACLWCREVRCSSLPVHGTMSQTLVRHGCNSIHYTHHPSTLRIASNHSNPSSIRFQRFLAVSIYSKLIQKIRSLRNGRKFNSTDGQAGESGDARDVDKRHRRTTVCCTSSHRGGRQGPVLRHLALEKLPLGIAFVSLCERRYTDNARFFDP